MGSYNVLTTTSYYTSPLQLTLKRMLDITGGIVGSILALLIIAVVGPKIKKASPGPILFKQIRIGRNAFTGCPHLTLVVPQGSVAEDYAREQRIRFRRTGASR